MAEKVEVVVLGAGYAGLAAAKTYLQCAPDTNLVVVDPYASIGGTWCKERLYPGLRSNNLYGTYEFPDFPMHGGYGVKTDQHVPGTVLHQYACDYADHFGVTEHIRLNTKVVSAARVEDNPEVCWRLDLEVNKASSVKSYSIDCQKLVVATGLTSQPLPLHIKGQDDFQAPIVTIDKLAQKYQEVIDAGKDGYVTVYGGGKSAYDSVYLFAKAGIQVNWIIRKSGFGATWMAPPYVYIGPLRCWVEQLTTRRFMAWFAPSLWGLESGYGWIYRLFHQTWLGRKFVDFFWYNLSKDTLSQSGVHRDPSLKYLIPDQSAMWYATSLAILNYPGGPTDFHDLIISGAVTIHREDITHLSRHTIHLSSGVSLPSPGGLISTGWSHTPNLTFHPPSLHSDLGIPSSSYSAAQTQFWSNLDARADAQIYRSLPRLAGAPVPPTRAIAPENDEERGEQQLRLHRCIAPPGLTARGDRSLAFVGFAAILLGQTRVEVAGLWTYAYLNNLIPSPSSEDIFYRTALDARWLRLRYPWGFGSKFPDFVFEQISWLDTMMVDLGLNPARKGSWWRELGEPYGPGDYRGITEEWLEMQRGKSEMMGEVGKEKGE